MNYLNLQKINNFITAKNALSFNIEYLNSLNFNNNLCEETCLYNRIAFNYNANICFWQSICKYPIENVQFTSIYSTLKTSIELFFDLYNLVCDRRYKSVLKFNSHYTDLNEEEKVILEEVYLKLKRSKAPFFTLMDKSFIAKNNNLLKIFNDKLVDLSQEANGYVHADIYKPYSLNKLEEAIDLIEIDFYIFMNSIKLYNIFYNRLYGTSFYLNIDFVCNQLNYCNNLIPSFITYNY